MKEKEQKLPRHESNRHPQETWEEFKEQVYPEFEKTVDKIAHHEPVSGGQARVLVGNVRRFLRVNRKWIMSGLAVTVVLAAVPVRRRFLRKK